MIKLNADKTPAEKMRNALKNDSDQLEEEFVLWSGQYSGKNMAGTWVLVALGTIVVAALMLAVSALRTSGTAWIVFLVALVFAWVAPLGVMFYRKLSYFYEVTNQRLKHRDGILVRTSNRIELIDIDDVIFKQGPIQSIMNVGNIVIKSSDSSHPELTMLGIADVKKVADTVDDARRAERRKRGLHIEAI